MLQASAFSTFYMCLLSLKICIMNVEINELNSKISPVKPCGQSHEHNTNKQRATDTDESSTSPPINHETKNKTMLRISEKTRTALGRL